MERGAVWVHYDDDDEGPDEIEEKAYFFQYRPNAEGEMLTEKEKGGVVNTKSVTYDEFMTSDSKAVKQAARYIFGGGLGGFILSGCEACCRGNAGDDHTIISFKNGLSISPTHYSMPLVLE